MNNITEKQTLDQRDPRTAQADRPVIFGLRYLEEAAMEVEEIVGCQLFTFTKITGSNCSDDSDTRSSD